MGKQNKKHKYHLEKGENNGWNSYYSSLKSNSLICIQDYEFLSKHCQLSKKDTSLFLSKNLNVEFVSSNAKRKKQFVLWYGDVISRTGRLPTLNDYFHCVDIIGSY